MRGGKVLVATSPDAADRFEQMQATYDRAINDLLDAVVSLGGPDAGPIGVRGFDGYWTGISGFSRVDPAPEGWRWTPSRNCMRPVQGKAGEAARAWLKDHAIPETPREELTRTTGLPWMIDGKVDDATGRGHWYFARLEVLDGRLWCTYSGGEFTWRQREAFEAAWGEAPASEYFAAQELAEAGAR